MSKRKKLKPQRLLGYIVLIFGAVLMVYPLLWLLSSSFKPNSEIFAREFTFIPKEFILTNYIDGWNINPQYSFDHFLFNTLFMVSLVVVGNMISCSLTAYALSRLNIRFKKIITAIILLTLMLPTQILLIPKYLLFSNLEWLSTYLPFIVPSFMATNAFFVYMLNQYMRGIPKELDESAKIDGCSSFSIYVRIIMPLSKPALFSVAIFSFIWTWNDFLNQLIFLSEVKTYTVALFLSTLVDSTAITNWGSLLALTTLGIMPSIIVYFLAQKYFVEGVATSGLKG